MKSLLALLAALIVAMLPASGRERLTGRVFDPADSSAVAGVSARLLGANGKIVRFATSGRGGVFSLRLQPADSGACRLQLAKMGYATVEMALDSVLRAAGPSDTLAVAMGKQSVMLREVGVNARRIREQGDTVSYAVGLFARKQDRTLGEVMNRMPGLEVDRGGKVKYQGTDINKFYVEGTDMAGEDYGKITNGLSSDDVRSVEVMENHQPMQVLRGISYSDRAAVNVRLKEKAKAKLMARGAAGAGYADSRGVAYDGDLFAMTVAGSVKNVTTAMVSDTRAAGISGPFSFGSDSGEELKAYTTAPGGDNFNRSASLSSNVVTSNSRGGQWRVAADYGYDHSWSDRTTLTTYYLEEGDREIIERRHNDRHSHVGSLSANFEINRPSYYLSNELAGVLRHNASLNDISGTLTNTQRRRAPQWQASNTLKLIKRFGGKHLVTVNSENRLMALPERLSVTDGSAGDYGTRIDQKAFYTDERASYGFVAGRVVTTVEAGLAALVRRLKSSVSGAASDGAVDLTNNMTTDYLRLFARARFELNLRRVSLRLSVPLNYYSYFFQSGTRHELFASPSVSAQWKPDARHEINASVSGRRSPADLHHMHTGLVLTDYRTLSGGADDYYSSTGSSAEVRWRWHNVRRGWFAHASVRQSWSRMKQGVAQTVVGDYVINSYRSSPSTDEGTAATGTISKSIDALRGKLTLSADWSRGSASMFSQGNAVDRRYSSAGVRPEVSVELCRWLNCEYAFGYSRNTLGISRQASQSLDSYTNRIRLTATPGRWVAWARLDHRRDRVATDRYENRLTLDASVSFRPRRRVELSLDLTNLTGSRRRVSTSFAGLTRTVVTELTPGRGAMLTIRFYN